MEFPAAGFVSNARIERTRYIAKLLEVQLLPELVLKKSWIRDHIFKQKLTEEQINNASQTACYALIDSDFQHWFDQQPNPDDIGLIASFSDHAVMCLLNAWFRGCIADGYMSLQELADITPEQAEAFCDYDVQQLFGGGENRQYIRLVIASSNWSALALMQDWFRCCIPKPLAFEQLADVTEGGYNAFFEQKVVCFLEKNPSYISLFISLSQAAGDALLNDYIWDQIIDGKINVDWFVRLDWDEFEELCGNTTQNAMDQDKQAM